MENFTNLNIHKHQCVCNFISCMLTNQAKILRFKDQKHRTEQKPDNTKTELLSMTKNELDIIPMSKPHKLRSERQVGKYN